MDFCPKCFSIDSADVDYYVVNGFVILMHYPAG